MIVVVAVVVVVADKASLSTFCFCATESRGTRKKEYIQTKVDYCDC